MMRVGFRQFALFSLLTGVFLVLGSEAYAAANPSAGQVVSNLTGDIKGSFPHLLSGFSYLFGLFLSVVSIFKFKDHVDNPNQTPLSAGMKRFLTGGMFLSLPFMTRVAQGLVAGGGLSGQGIHGSIDAVDCTGVCTPDGLDHMIVSFMNDIGGPMQVLLGAFSYIFATGFLLLGISRLNKRMDEGPRGPAGMGTIMTFITSGVLFSGGHMMGAIANTLFGTNNGEVKVKANVDPNGTMGFNAADIAKIEVVVQAVMMFVIIVGIIAFIRGWFVLRAFADGQQGATLAQGLTFILGGALAINLGPLINAIETTLGINSGITFTTN